MADNLTYRDLLGKALPVIYSLDAKLSLLRHRCERDIPWGTLGVYQTSDIDETIGHARRIEDDIARALDGGGNSEP